MHRTNNIRGYIITLPNCPDYSWVTVGKKRQVTQIAPSSIEFSV